jgi:hypothetical protein
MVELPTALAMTSNPDPSVGEECQKSNLNMVVGEDARSLDLWVARILPEAVSATWKVHRLWDILSTASRVPGYSKNFVTHQRSSHV